MLVPYCPVICSAIFNVFLPSPKSTVPSILPIPLNSMFLPAILLVKSKSFISPFNPTYFLCSGVAAGLSQKPYFLAIPDSTCEFKV